MNKPNEIIGKQLTEHFFRNEYGKIVSVVTKFLGVNNVETAEDIVQDTMLKAVDNWQQKGVPENPEAWLYTTAKNITRNILKRKKHQITLEIDRGAATFDQFEFSEEIVTDDQLKMMFACCHASIPENSQIALILKILCGFSITEISNAFFSTNETINKRLVRGRKQLRKNHASFIIPKDINGHLSTVLKTIYLLFNEGYSPSQKSELIRFDLCLESIRLVKLLVKSKAFIDKTDCYALLALMHLNASRFEARMSEENSIIEMENQDRSKWDEDLINQGIQFLNQATEGNKISRYLILATISANHCIANNFQETNWKVILSLYDNLLTIEDSPNTRLNRAVALSHVKGNKTAIRELKAIGKNSDIGSHYLFHATLAEFYKRENNSLMVAEHLNKAMSLTKNKRDLKLLAKKLMDSVPIS